MLRYFLGFCGILYAYSQWRIDLLGIVAYNFKLCLLSWDVDADVLGQSIGKNPGCQNRPPLYIYHNDDCCGSLMLDFGKSQASRSGFQLMFEHPGLGFAILGRQSYVLGR